MSSKGFVGGLREEGLKLNLSSLSFPALLSPHKSSQSKDLHYQKRSKQSDQSEEALRRVMFLSCWGPN